MVYILHLSDLHFVKNAAAYNTEAIISKEAKQKVKNLPEGKKLLIITGDFHNFVDTDYDSAEQFILNLVSNMDLDLKKDVFIIPGNHDVGNNDTLKNCLEPSIPGWKLENAAFVEMLKQGKLEYVPGRLRAFRPYSTFAQKLGIYDISKGLDYPAQVHIRKWRNKLTILHLNTALCADGNGKTNQIADTASAASGKTWNENYDPTIPAIAIGHNNFFDLQEAQRRDLATTFALRNVSAYLCGDNHLTEKNPERQMIRLEAGHRPGAEIPNLVAARGIADGSDTYSDVGYCWHYWNEDTDEVTVEFRKWTRNSLAKTELNGENGIYQMRKEQ